MIKVGEKLQEQRKKKGLTLEEVAKATKIRVSFLSAIEEGHYNKLPGSSYAHGFVKNYLEYVGLPTKEYLALFRREYDENQERKVLPEGLVGREGIPLRRFSLASAFWAGGLIILALGIYLFFQYRAAFFSPSLTISSPKTNDVIVSSSLLVSGTTDTNTTVTINTLPAYVDANGKFTKELPVFPGPFTVVVKAVNSFGKITEVDRQVTIKAP